VRGAGRDPSSGARKQLCSYFGIIGALDESFHALHEMVGALYYRAIYQDPLELCSEHTGVTR
jgi:hypothetical protein